MDNTDNHANDKRQAQQELKDAVESTHEVLVSATTIFPFTLFPDTITVDREKISVTRRVFFKLAEVTTIRVEDVLNITADIGPFMGSLKMTTRFFDPEKPYVINYLWRRDATKIKRIIAGYITALQKGIDSSALGTRELAELLDRLGQSAPGEDV